ncbi:MAG: alpha-L-rhamnosidase N-terminal domain-containing protein [Bacteroidales bacterium]|nr:alpha-L-rhamnosidase N-terminal domain-containing protein [Bacteroidales bacterium]
MKRFSALVLLALLVAGLDASAQFGPRRDPSAPFDLATENWNARWISAPETVNGEYGVYYFRKDVDLAAVPADYVVHVTGDNRYKLYVNGTLVSLGPAKGDATHWNYETVDLAPYLKAGQNVIAALVYHEGPQKPDSQISVSTGFLLQGEGNAKALYTDRTWKCLKESAYSPERVNVSGYYVAGPGEKVDMSAKLEGWNTAAVSTDGWADARQGAAGEPKNVMSSGQGDGHNLVPSMLPQMELTPQRLSSVRKAEGVTVPAGFLQGKAPLTVPAHTQAVVLLDQSFLTNAYFNVKMDGGKGAKLTIGYAESLFIPAEEQDQPDIPAGINIDDIPAEIIAQYAGRPRLPRTVGKGNRNEVDGKVFIGREDVLLPSGEKGQTFTTLNWRTYRYVQLKVETAGDPLTIEDVSGTFTGYPFTLDAALRTGNKELQKMLEIGWRTARLCAVETYMDCPYYEQLQYLGDTRIQALITLYNSSDDRMVKNFLHLADISRNADGITKSRYPTTQPQYIQPYALSYIYAMHDYLMYGADTGYVMDLVPGAEQIIGYFHRFQQADGRIKDLPGWNFSDWVYTPGWDYGAPRKGADGCSINMDLQLLYAYQMMADMEDYRGNTWQAGEYRKEAAKLADAVKKAYWNPARGLFSDRAEQDLYSQHGNALAILCGIVDDPKALAEKLLTDQTLSPCSVYYKFYLHQALVEAGLGNQYLDWLDIWRENISMGMTTWGETSDVNGTRSDCHAWGASPNIELFRTVLGIDSDAVAFKKVKIEPHLGSLKEIGGTMPHPAGAVQVNYKVTGNNLHATVDLPEGVDGTFVWKGQSHPLHGGSNVLNLK